MITIKYIGYAAISVIFAFLLSVPFLPSFIPSSDIIILNVGSETPTKILARGVEILWFNWQSYIYIFLGSLIAFAITTIVMSWISANNSAQIKKSQDALDEQIASLKQTEETFVDTHTKKIRKQLDEQYQHLADRLESCNNAQRLLNESQEQAEKLRRQTDKNDDYQAKLNTGALNQKRRAVKQKRLIIAFLEAKEWRVNDELLTYARLLEMATEFADQKVD